MDKTLNRIVDSLNFLLKRESDVSSVAGEVQGETAHTLTRNLSLPTFEQLSTSCPSALEESSWAGAASKTTESSAFCRVRFVLEKGRNRHKEHWICT